MSFDLLKRKPGGRILLTSTPSRKLFAIPFLNQRDLQFLFLLLLLFFFLLLQIIPFNCDRWKASFSRFKYLNRWNNSTIIYISFENQVISLRIKYFYQCVVSFFLNLKFFQNSFLKWILFFQKKRKGLSSYYSQRERERIKQRA